MDKTTCPQVVLFYGPRYKHVHFSEHMNCCSRGRGIGAVWLQYPVGGERDEHRQSFLWEVDKVSSEGCIGVFQEQREERIFLAEGPAKMWIEKEHAPLSG